jgi:hypothetical protein
MTDLGLGYGATSLVQKISVEVLNIGASSAITIQKGLTALDRGITGNVPSEEQQHFSRYANQPENFSQGG